MKLSQNFFRQDKSPDEESEEENSIVVETTDQTNYVGNSGAKFNSFMISKG